jgi:hypothetical protein
MKRYNIMPAKKSFELLFIDFVNIIGSVHLTINL